MATVVVLGIEVEEISAEYLRFVVNNAGSGDIDKQEVRRRALKNLGRLGCNTALFYLIEKYAGSGDEDKREVRRMAFEGLEEIDGLQ